MQAGTLMKLGLGTVAAAFLVILAVFLLRMGESCRVLSPTGEAEGPPSASRAADGGTASRQMHATARVPADSSPLDVAAQAAVKGIVRDTVGTSLAGVHTAARRLDGPRAGDALSTTITDTVGSFTLALPRDVLAEVAFSFPGYRPHREMVRAPASGLDVVLERSPTLKGRVVRGDGMPVSGAMVRWSNPHLALGAGETTATAADGRFAFADVPWAVDLEVLAADALPVYRFVHITWGMPELVVTIDGGREATGTVVDAGSDAGIAGASVALWYYGSTYTAEGRRGGPAQQAEIVTTGSGGDFTLTKLPSASDKKRPDAWLWVSAPGRASHWKIIPFPERAGKLRVALYPAGSVRGRVVDASGAPVPGQRVYAEAGAQPLCDAGPNRDLRWQDGCYSVMWSTRRPDVVAPFQTEREAFTDSLGTYVIGGIPCPVGGGEVTVAVFHGPPRVTVVARPGETAVASDLVRPEGLLRRWHGLVVDEHRRPVAGATIEVGVARTIADARGRFDFEVPMIPETREIRASAHGHVPFRGVVPADDEGGVTITLARGVRLAVLVADRGQRPVPNVSVQVFSEGGLADLAKGGPQTGALRRAYTDDRGAVLLEGVPSTCDVLIDPTQTQARAQRRVLQAVAAGILRVTLEDLDLFEGTAVLTVRVLDGRTDAAFGGLMLVEAASEKSTRRRLAQGPEVRLDGLSLGTWEVSVAAEGLGARNERVELREDRRLDVCLGQGVVVSGQVTCAARALARPVQVSACELASKRLSVTRTDADGRFALAGMGPGEYLLSVEPFESAAFQQWPMRIPQDQVSTAPVKMRIAAGVAPAPVTLLVVPVAPLSVTVVPDAAACAGQSVWSWTQGLRFTVTDDRGGSVYAGGPSDVMTEAAELLLRLPEGRYTVRVQRRGEMLGERTLMAGESWKMDAR